jgi:hypothetical protein
MYLERLGKSKKRLSQDIGSPGRNLNTGLPKYEAEVLRTRTQGTRLKIELKRLTIDPLRPKLVKIIFKNSVRTAKKTPHFTVTKINRLTLFKEIIAVYSENYTKHINKNAELTVLIVKAHVTCSYHLALKG